MAEADSAEVRAAIEAAAVVIAAAEEEATVAVVVAANAAVVTVEAAVAIEVDVAAPVVDLTRPACCNDWIATETARWIPMNKKAPPDS